MSEKKLLAGSVLPTHILVRIEEEKEKTTTSGLVLIEKKSNSHVIGEIVVVGDGTPSLPMMVKVGQRIIFAPLSSQLVTIDGEDYRLLAQSSILYILPKTE
jgi:co-chaperonin GroES (HSP10)